MANLMEALVLFALAAFLFGYGFACGRSSIDKRLADEEQRRRKAIMDAAYYQQKAQDLQSKKKDSE